MAVLVARVGIATLLLLSIAVASVSIGIDKWTLNFGDSNFFTTGLRTTCSVNGCSDNNYVSGNFTVGSCSVSPSVVRRLNHGAWGVQIAGIVTGGVGALLVLLSSKLTDFKVLAAALGISCLGFVTYIVGGAVAYYTHSEYLYCGQRYCDQYYTVGTYCLSQQGPSFALWVISIALSATSLLGGGWITASDARKQAALSLRPTRREDPTSPPSALVGGVEPPLGYVYRPESGLYFHEGENMFFDPRSGHYFSPRHNSWYDSSKRLWYSVAPAVTGSVPPTSMHVISPSRV